MATYSYTFGTGGTFATIADWQTNRLGGRNGDPALTSGDVEEAVAKDGKYVQTLNLNTGWPAGVTVRIRAENPHLGDFEVTSQGARFESSAFNSAYYANGTFAGITFELVDLVAIAASATAYRPAVGLSPNGLTFRTVRTMLRGNNLSGNAAIRITGGASTDVLVQLRESIITTIAGGGTRALQCEWTAGQQAKIEAQGSYIHSIQDGSAAGQASSFNLQGCFVESTLNANHTRIAVDCIRGTGSWSGWTTTHCEVGAFVTGTPASGQVGFGNLSTYDYSLVDHPNNIAIDFAVNATMSATDILGNARDASPDCGPYEVIAAGTTLTPGSATATLTAFAPTVVTTADVVLTPGIGELTATPYTPTVTVTADLVLTPGIGELTVTAQTPTVVVTADVSLVPGAATATLTPFTPTVIVGDNQIVEPGATTVVLTPFAPTVTVTTALTVEPGAATLTITAYAPTVTASTAVTLLTPEAGTLELVAHAPTVTTTAPATVVTDGVPEGAAGQEAVGVYPQRVALQAGDEWFVTLSGPSADAPAVRVVVRFRE